MKNKVWVILFSGIFMVIMSIGLETAMLNQINRSNGSCGLDKVVLTARRHLGGENSRYLNLDDINYLARKLSGCNLSYLARQDAVVEGNHNTAGTKVLGTNQQATKFYHLEMESGSLWTQAAEQEGQLVAVISADLAVQLYGSTDVQGVQISILGKQFLITGVLKPEAALLERLSDDRMPEVYIPGEAFFAAVPNPTIREIQIQSRQGKQETAKLLPGLLSEMCIDSDFYKVIDYQPVRKLMEQVPRIQIFIIGIMLIWALLRIMRQNFHFIIRLLREDGRDYYFRDFLIKRRREISRFMILTAVLLIIILFLWNRIHFNLYIPSRYIPDELIDISYFTEAIRQDISNVQVLAEYFRPGPQVQLDAGRVINHWLYYCIWPLGMVLVLYAWSKIKKREGKSYEEKILELVYDRSAVDYRPGRLWRRRKTGGD